MKDHYPEYRKENITTEYIYSHLVKAEQEIVDKFLTYCSITAGKGKLKDIKTNILQFRDIVEKHFEKNTLNDVRAYLAILNQSGRAKWTKNGIKIHVKKFLKWKFKDWYERFNELADIKLSKNPRNEERINDSTLVTKEELSKLLRIEDTIRGKALLFTLYETAARPQEVRLLRWSGVEYLEDKITKISLYSRKTGHSRAVFVKDATIHLKRWEQEYINSERKLTDYVFPSKKASHEPMGKSALEVWLRRLSHKAKLGRTIYPYLLRHTRLTEIWDKLGDVIVHRKFAGHSQDSSMTSLYVHLSDKNVKDSILRKVYQVDESHPSKTQELENENKHLRAEVKNMRSIKEEWHLLKRHFPMIQEVFAKAKSVEQLEAAYRNKSEEELVLQNTRAAQ